MMKKKVLGIVLVVMSVLALCACSDTGKNPAASPSATVEITEKPSETPEATPTEDPTAAPTEDATQAPGDDLKPVTANGDTELTLGEISVTVPDGWYYFLNMNEAMPLAASDTDSDDATTMVMVMKMELGVEIAAGDYLTQMEEQFKTTGAEVISSEVLSGRGYEIAQVVYQAEEDGVKTYCITQGIPVEGGILYANTFITESEGTFAALRAIADSVKKA